MRREEFQKNLARSQAHSEWESFQELYRSGKYRYIPICAGFVTDSETPVTAFAKLTGKPGRFLLESVERGEQVGRYSFIGWEPLVIISAMGLEVTINEMGAVTTYTAPDPMAEVQKKLESLQVAPISRPMKFYGGAVGYLGYDYVRLIEKLPAKNPYTTGVPDLQWMVPKYLACFDHVSHKITIIVLAEVMGDEEESYQKALTELETILARFQNKLNLPPLDDFQNSGSGVAGAGESRSSLTKTEFMERVDRIKEYILAGDAFQVVLAQRISQPFTGDPLLFYRILRTINPSPYLFYLDFGGFQLAGSSPEVMVRLEDQAVILKPIAGTRPRGKTPAEDLQLKHELINDEKERAEHVMLVDLGRNDLGRVCKFGTVNVAELMTIENYSHVMHIVSLIKGELLPGLTGVELLRAVFPAGTLSGAPKIRAMEIIEELEPIRREFYGGAVGYLGFNGNLDTCITIRTVMFKDGLAHIQAGAGIVADSVPEKEYEETLSKAGAMLKALAKTEQLTRSFKLRKEVTNVSVN
ncbi:MAG: anthranilate synthase component I [Firmicutes bacterium]|nr:anthranilate synthase component I [Bacillota bacterium]